MLANEYDIGDEVRMSAVFQTLDKTATDPTVVKAKVKLPDDSVTEYVYGTDTELVRDSAGAYHVDLVLAASGRYYFRWEGTGMVTAAEERYFTARVSKFS